MKKLVKKRKKQLNANSLKNRSAIIVGLLFLSLFVIIYQVNTLQDVRGRAQVSDCTVSATEIAIDAEEQKMLTLVNAHRQQNGAGPLKFSPTLNKASAWLSVDMSTKQNLDHTDSLGRAPDTRVTACGGQYSAENIAMGNTTADQTFAQWKSSSGHNENMLNAQYVVIGISRSGEYWTQDFGESDDSGTGTIPTAPAVLPSSTALAPTSGTGIVPSPGCIGSCPTLVPTSSTPENQPTSILPPDSGDNGNLFPSIPATDLTNPDGTTPNNNSGGFFGLLISLLTLFFEFLKSLIN